MAKKKTPGPDVTDSSLPGPARRRATKRTATSASPQPVSSSVSPIADAGSPALAIDTAADRGRPRDIGTATADASGNGHSSQDVPTYEQIAEAAYQRYLRRGGEHGRDFDDWLEAERELRSRS